MKAIVFNKSIPRYVALKLLGAKRAARIATGSFRALCPVSMQDVRPPEMPTGEWLRVTPTLTGICGSDLGVICSKSSPYLSPLTSTPFVLGHEAVGVVSEVGKGAAEFEDAHGSPHLAEGSRVILEPALGCIVRGIAPLCAACQRNQPALCRNVTRGHIAAGIQTGYCHDTGGGWSGSFVAHRSQLHPIPDGMSDSVAVLAEPLACVLHGALRVPVCDDDTVLVLGCGSIGLLTIAALRACGVRARIVAVAKYAHQREHAECFGADVVLDAVRSRDRKQIQQQWAEALGAELHYPEIGKPTVIGGANVTFDCIGSSDTIDDSMRFTDADGKIVLIGMPGIASNIDWTALWYKELTLYAAYAYGPEEPHARVFGNGDALTTWEIVGQVLETWGDRLVCLVGEPFELADYRRAFHSALFTGASGQAKTVFRIT